MNIYKTGQLKDRCGLHLSSWSCLPVGLCRLWLGIANIPSHTVILACVICAESPILFFLSARSGAGMDQLQCKTRCSRSVFTKGLDRLLGQLNWAAMINQLRLFDSDLRAVAITNYKHFRQPL